MTAFAPNPSTFGSRYLIRKYRTDEVRVQGCPVPNWGFRYGTDGLSTTLYRRLTKRDGGGGILIFRLQKIRGKASILILIHAQAKNIRLINRPSSSLDSRL